MAPSDPRFASRLANDPRFIRPSKASTKVTLDDRFKDLLQSGGGESSANAARVDKYGRKVGKNKSANDLKAFYRLDDKGKGKQQQQQVVDRARGEGLVESSSEEEDESSDESEEEEQDSEDDEEDDEAGDLLLGSKKARKAAAKKQRHQERAGGDDAEALIDLDEDDGPLASTSAYPVSGDVQVEASIPTMEGSTKRIAIVNLDWDNVRSIDIYKVFDSVLSPSASGLVEGTSLGSRKSKTKIGKGRVVSVKIYPSQFGKERMEREEKEGPPVEIFSKNRKPVTATKKAGGKRRKAQQAEEGFTDSEDSDQEDEGNEYDEVALRRYQLERLRYYYAVVEFDTLQAAQHAYEEIEGTEFEATANVLDLRYVPDDTTFEDTPTDTATANSVEVQAYKPVEFVTDALRNSKVKLTWDADDPARAKLLKGTHDALTSQKGKKSSSSSTSRKAEAAVDYSALLASDSEDDAEAARRMRSAFGLSAERGSDDEDSAEEGAAMMDAFNSRENGEGRDMEITFGPALSGTLNEDEDEDGDKDETSLDAYQRKERERRLARKEKRKAEKKRLANKEGKGRTLLDNEDGGSDPDEAFDANQFEAAGNDEDGNDIFFAGGSDRASDDDNEEGGGIATEKKLSKKAARQLEREAKAKEAASLSLLVNDGENGSDAEEGGGDGRHFDMQAILRAEKISSKPKKVLKKGKDRRKHAEAKELLQREKDKFEVDTKDDRFKKLHEDHEFALDPSNPRYMKTKNMDRLLEESRKRRSDKQPVEPVHPASSSTAAGAKGSASNNNNGLSSLVESIKRKSSSSLAPTRNGSHLETKDGEKKTKKQKTKA